MSRTNLRKDIEIPVEWQPEIIYNGIGSLRGHKGVCWKF